MKSKLFFLFALTIVLGCSSPSPDFFRERGSATLRGLIKELKACRTREEFVDRQKKIEHYFIEIKELCEEIKIYLKNNPKADISLFSRQNQDLSDELQAELNRLLRQEGCREVINQWLIMK